MIPEFCSTLEAQLYAAEKMNDETFFVVFQRRFWHLDRVKQSQASGDINAAFFHAFHAQYDREACEAYQRKERK